MAHRLLWSSEHAVMPSGTYHERLSALDATFLGVEDRCSHMHIGSIGVFEPGTITGPGGAVDLDRVRRLVAVVLEGLPRYRQRVESTPIFGHPVWVDDASFNPLYHLRHTRLPLPGDERQLKRLTARLMSQQLDRGKPLWETWFVEGLPGDRFAIVSKVHHCMVDGVGGVEVTTATMRAESGPDPRLDLPIRPYAARPAPSRCALVRAELAHRLKGAAGFVGGALRSVTEPRRAADNLAGTVMGLVEAALTTARPASVTPFNVEIGPHRRFDWTAMDLAAVKAVKAGLGGTVNDVVLAVVAGAMRRYLGGRGVDVDRLEFRAMVPVNIRAGYTGTGNRVASVVVRLPVDQPEPRRRLEHVRRETDLVKHSHQVDAARAVEDVVDWTFPTLISRTARLAGVSQPFNLVVTNVPGPQFPLYFLGSRMLECYPLVPIFHYEALGIALFSYDGRLFWGINADWDAVPGVHDFVAAIDAEFALLEQASGTQAGPARRPDAVA